MGAPRGRRTAPAFLARYRPARASRVAPGMFEPGAGVAAEMRRVHHFYGELVLLGQREEASGNLQNVLNEGVLDPVAHEIEEARASGRFPYLFQETRPLRRMAAESPKA